MSRRKSYSEDDRHFASRRDVTLHEFTCMRFVETRASDLQRVGAARTKERSDAGLQESTGVAESASTRSRAYELSSYLQEPKGWPLQNQILKAAISIPSNIAEGGGRGSDSDFCRFLWYSMGSCNEFESDLMTGRDVKLIPGPLFTQLGNELSDVRKTLTRLIQTVDPGSR